MISERVALVFQKIQEPHLLHVPLLQRSWTALAKECKPMAAFLRSLQIMLTETRKGKAQNQFKS